MPARAGFAERRRKKGPTMKRMAWTVSVLGVCVGMLLPAVVRAQQFMGVGVAKQCVGPPNVDPQEQGIARVGDTITCTIQVTNLDEAGNALRVDSVTDTVHHFSGTVITQNLLDGPTVLPVLDT